MLLVMLHDLALDQRRLILVLEGCYPRVLGESLLQHSKPRGPGLITPALDNRCHIFLKTSRLKNFLSRSAI